MVIYGVIFVPNANVDKSGNPKENEVFKGNSEGFGTFEIEMANV